MTSRLLRPFSFAVALVLLSVSLSSAQAQGTGGRDGLRLAPIVAAADLPPRPGRWWPLPVTLINSTDQDRTGIVVGKVSGEIQTEYAVRVPVPPNSTIKRNLWIKLPNEPGGSDINITAAFSEVIDGRAIQTESDDARAIQDLRVKLDDQPIVTAAIRPLQPIRTFEYQWRKDSRDHVRDLMVAVRQSDRLSTMILDIPRLPVDARYWDAVDCVYIADMSGMNDPAGIASLRQWLVDGGKAWIMLDRVPLESVEPLLGDVWQATELARYEMTEFEIRTKLRPDMADKPRQVNRYHPATVLALEQHGGEVTHHINDWPAAIRVGIGKGEVWLTTVDASAWYEPAVLGQLDTFRPDNLPNDWAIPIVSSFQQSREPEALDFVSTQRASSYVGYPVPSFATVIGSLGFFSLATLAIGTYLWYRGRLELVGWCVPAIALIAATPLFASASSNRNQVEDTTAHIQFANVQPGSGQAVVEDRTAVYVSQPMPLDIEMPPDAYFQPFVDSSTPAPYQWLSEDTGDVSLNFSNWPTGLQPVHGHFTSAAGETEAVGRLTDAGLSVRLPDSLPGSASDPVLFNPPASVDVLRSAGGAAGEYLLSASVPRENEIRLSTGMVNQDQQTHQDVYRELLGEDREQPLLGRRGVMVWAGPWKSPLDAIPGVAPKGESLNALTLRLLPVQAGQRVSIPPAVIDVEAVGVALGDSISSQIARGQTHTPLPTARQFRLRWRLPPEALPLKIESAKLAMTVDIPERSLTLTSTDGTDDSGDRKPIGQFDSPSESIVVDIAAEDLVYDSGSGEIVIEFDVSERINQEPAKPVASPPADDDSPIMLESGNAPTWQILRPELTVTGTVLSPG